MAAKATSETPGSGAERTGGAPLWERGQDRGQPRAWRPHYLALLGLDELSEVEVLQRVESGIEFRQIERLRDQIGLPLQRLAEAAQIPPSTLHRRKKEGRFPPLESDRLLRVSRLIGLAVDLFEGDTGAASRWMNSPQRGLGGAVPLDLAKSDVGARMVENLIGRLEDGVFT